ncbi:MAG: site-2 protease family protein [Chthoniobacterales bacterium]|nr:site-2 protease family protein [Chthoniobacterales bacterium]
MSRLEESQFAGVRSEEVPPLLRRESAWSKIRKLLGPVLVVGLFALKFIGKLKFLVLPLLKFLPVLLKSGGSMIFMIWVYAALWGWKWGLGFVLLLLLHECGHLIAAKRFGLKVSAPMFIPFMGAFIALKEAPRNAWIEAGVGIGGPILGSAAALLCHAIGYGLHAPLFIGLAWTAYFLNLFNLTPVGMLDGGRIATALSPWLWVPGLAVLGWIGWTHPNFIIWLVLLMSLPRVFSLFRKRTEEEQRFYEVTPAQRWSMAAMYFGLIAALVFGMHVALDQLAGHGIHPGTPTSRTVVQ